MSIGFAMIEGGGGEKFPGCFRGNLESASRSRSPVRGAVGTAIPPVGRLSTLSLLPANLFWSSRQRPIVPDKLPLVRALLPFNCSNAHERSRGLFLYKFLRWHLRKIPGGLDKILASATIIGRRVS